MSDGDLNPLNPGLSVRARLSTAAPASEYHRRDVQCSTGRYFDTVASIVGLFSSYIEKVSFPPRIGLFRGEQDET